LIGSHRNLLRGLYFVISTTTTTTTTTKITMVFEEKGDWKKRQTSKAQIHGRKEHVACCFFRKIPTR